MPYADTDFSAATRAVLAERWALTAPEAPPRLYGGEESAAFAVGRYAVRIGPRHRTTAEAEWCHAVATRVAARVPEAVAPCRTTGGGTVARADGRPVSVWPLRPGTWPDAGNPRVAAQAAALLARLHRALAELRPPPRPAPALQEVGLDGTVTPADPALHDPRLDRWLRAFPQRAAYGQALHGDYYAGNTLAVDGALTTVLDWDEVWVGPPAAEVASAALEWLGGFPTSARAMAPFAAAYAAAGGPAGLVDEESLAQLARHRLRRDAASHHAACRRGVVPDAEDVAYHARRLRAFADLRP